MTLTFSLLEFNCDEALELVLIEDDASAGPGRSEGDNGLMVHSADSARILCWTQGRCNRRQTHLNSTECLSNSSRSRRQQQDCRKDRLLFKSFEYCQECDAGIFIMIRLKHNGQIQFLNSDNRWPPSLEKLVDPSRAL